MSKEASEAYNIPGEIRHDRPAIAVLLLMGMAGALALPHLPPLVPVHWGIGGQVNGYAPRLVGAAGIPLMTAAVWLVLVAVPAIDPKRRNYASFLGFYRAIRLAVVLLMAVVYALTLLTGLGRTVDVGLVTTIAVAALFIFLGNSMQRLRFNYFVGIRTPWTLSNEEVWRRTHRFASRSLVLGGLVGLLGAALPAHARAAVFLAGILGGVLAPAIYSYVVFRRLVR